MNERGPLYQYIEFCRNAETLWHKLHSGHWDWLGRKPDGQFVLGSPRRNRSMVSASGTVYVGAAEEGKHGIREYGWGGLPQKSSGGSWYGNAAQARAAFKELIAYYDRPEQAPRLLKLVLIENGYPTDERFIAQTPPPNYR